MAVNDTLFHKLSLCLANLRKLQQANKNQKRQKLLTKRIKAIVQQLPWSALKKSMATAAITGALFSANDLSAQVAFGPKQLSPFNMSTSSLTTSSTPAFGDFNNDGDLDIITTGGQYADFHYLQNVGFANAPNFVGNSIVNPYGLINPGVGGGNPLMLLVGDLDNDGDLDILRNEGLGYCYYFQNTGSAGNASFSAGVPNPFNIAIPTNKSISAFVDLDNDGDLDIVGGGSTYSHYNLSTYKTYNTQNFIYIENIGTASVPNFAAPVNNPFNLVGITAAGLQNPKVGFADLDGDNDLDMICGMTASKIGYYENIGTVTTPNFDTCVVNPFGLTGGGSCSFGDLDNDGDLDILVQSYNFPSRIAYYENISVITSNKNLLKNTDVDYSLYPNPTNNNFTIELDEIVEEVEVTINNNIGQEVLSQSFQNTRQLNLDLNSEAGVGIYFIHVKTKNREQIFKLLKTAF